MTANNISSKPSDQVSGKTLRLTWADGPTNGTTQEHVFHQDGTRRSGHRLVPKARVRPANRFPDRIGAIGAMT